MDSVRCVIANIRPQLLADIVQSLAQDSGGIEVLERIGSIDELPALISRLPVDVLILGLEDLPLYEAANAALRTVSTLPIVGLGNDGRRLVVCLDNVGTSEMVRIIKALPRAGGQGTA